MIDVSTTDIQQAIPWLTNMLTFCSCAWESSQDNAERPIGGRATDHDATRPHEIVSNVLKSPYTPYCSVYIATAQYIQLSCQGSTVKTGLLDHVAGHATY
jgi:hypothetical protein